MYDKRRWKQHQTNVVVELRAERRALAERLQAFRPAGAITLNDGDMLLLLDDLVTFPAGEQPVHPRSNLPVYKTQALVWRDGKPEVFTPAAAVGLQEVAS